MIGNLVLRLIHYVLSLGIFVKHWILHFPYLGFAFQQKALAGSLSYGLQTQIEADARSFQKLPHHLGLLVLENDVSFSDIANLIVWSITLGISYISVFDINGEFKRKHDLLREEIRKSQQSISDTENSKHNIHIHSSFTDRRNVSQNGCHSGNSVHIQLLSTEDGRHDLVQTARELCLEVMEKRRRIDDISPQSLDNLLQEIHKFPDPDLVLKFGQTDSLLGYLPWQMRLAEILCIPSHTSIRYKSFSTAIQNFSSINQRFGK
ncbi:dehydrodolichyl diphosphate synthase complex subunit nus1-like [Mizuhopecten yessoensis]|uniref:dehydrodolichyl diphosphate synthase complex subunit nus1-like n=1 Tax=Mizuhopecten yessoensis TaxID=6573 RepID=UPI000B4574F5|nr:dehydrodolichyl diphosphate synthase complex subunit nus1-like [Mizuhopecten yessoensis]